MSAVLKEIETRIKHKIDSVENWTSVEETFIPLDGELIIYRGVVDAHSKETLHFKVGNGSSTLKNLPFAYDVELLELATAIAAEAKTREESDTYLSESKADKLEGVFYIEGDKNTSTVDSTNKISIWKGSCKRIDTLQDGLTIRYKIPVEGNSTTKLHLTYGKELDETSELILYRFSTTKLTTQFPVGSIVAFTYHEDLNSGCWVANDYDSNTNTQVRNYNRKHKDYDKEYPITARGSNSSVSTGSYKAEYGFFTPDVTLNPYTGTITALYFSGNGSNLTSLNASNVSSGTLPVANLPTSGATAGTYGYNDSSILTSSGSFTVPILQVDMYGRITSIEDHMLTLPVDMYHKPEFTSGLLIGTNAFDNGLYVPTGTTANTVALGNHNHDKIYAPISHPHDYIPLSEKGVVNGVATLDTNGLVPSSQLPSYVDDVINGQLHTDGFFYKSDNQINPQQNSYTKVDTPEKGKIYFDIVTNKSYRYSGNDSSGKHIYVEIPSSLALSNQLPQQISLTSSATGTDSTAARADHVHKLTIGSLTNNGSVYIPTIQSGNVVTSEGCYLYNSNNTAHYFNVGCTKNSGSIKGGLTIHSGVNGSNNYINLVCENDTQSFKQITLPSVNGRIITNGNLDDITYINGGTI